MPELDPWRTATLTDVPADEQEDAWSEIHEALRQFEGRDGFAGPCEMLVGVGQA